jgi:hypothetical protein
MQPRTSQSRIDAASARGRSQAVFAHTKDTIRQLTYCPQVTSWSPQGMRVLRQCTVPRAEVMFVTIQRESIRPSKKEMNKVLQCLNCPMFAVRLWITTSLYRWTVGSLPSTCMFSTTPALHEGCLHPAGINSWPVVTMFVAAHIDLIPSKLNHLQLLSGRTGSLSSCEDSKWVMKGRTWSQFYAK